VLIIQGEFSQTEMVEFWNFPILSRMTIVTNLFLKLFRMDIAMAAVTTGISILILDYLNITDMTG
jgi:hypothetical protein